MNFIGTYRIFPQTAAEHTFSIAHETLPRMDHMVGYKSRLNELKRIGICGIAGKATTGDTSTTSGC